MIPMNNKAPACTHCHLSLHCVCDLIPTIESPIHIALLMHENELKRETNSGQWLLASLTKCTQHTWRRNTPSESLIELMNQPDIVPMLVFPNDSSRCVSQTRHHWSLENNNKTPLFIILDGTWQEAKKMANKSPWLAQCQTVHLSPSTRSNYQLRRNQADGHLCTLEVGAELLRLAGADQASTQLTDFFHHYMKVYHADKCGHRYKSQD